MEERLPLDSPLNSVYRAGGAVSGAVLLIFGAVGFFQGVKFFTVHGEKVLGLYSNGLLSLISVIVGLVLIGVAFLGGNLAATTNTAAGVLLLGSGVVNLALIRTDANFLAFRINNVFFSFVLGLVLLTCGLYGRVTPGTRPGNRTGAVSRGHGASASG